MNNLLHRHFSLVVLALVAVVALFSGEGLANVIAARLVTHGPPLWYRPLPARGSRASIADHHATSAGAILARNPFDSITGPLGAPAPPEAVSTGGVAPEPTDPFNAPDCEGARVVVIAGSADLDRSFAALEAPGGGGAVLRGAGGDVGGRTVQFVGWDRVWMSSGGALCQSRMFASERSRPGPPVPSAPAPAPGAAPAPPDSIQKRVRRLSPTEFELDRGLVDEIVGDPSLFMGSSRIVPVQENGRTVGVRLLGIRPDTLLGIIGLENGDRLQAINGFEVGNPEKALEAYARLRGADHLTLNLSRNGKEMAIDYAIR